MRDPHTERHVGEADTDGDENGHRGMPVFCAEQRRVHYKARYDAVLKSYTDKTNVSWYNGIGDEKRSDSG